MFVILFIAGLVYMDVNNDTSLFINILMFLVNMFYTMWYILDCQYCSPNVNVDISTTTNLQFFNITICLHGYRMGSNLGFLSGEQGHWVKPKNITIFFCNRIWWWFLVGTFRITRNTLFDIVNHLKLLIWKQDTKYCFAILVELDVACAIYKLAQGINLDMKQVFCCR